MKLIIGLGNPGEKYADTRHNLGFMVVDEFARKHLGPKIIWEEDKKFKAEILKLVQDDKEQLLLVKPQTFMNNSGLAVKAVVDYFKVDLEDVIVVYDELDLPLGKIKVRMGGAAAGHHGVESILDTLNADGFIRVRLGIGNEKTRDEEHKGIYRKMDSFVTDQFKSDEKPKVKHILKQAVDALELLLKAGLSVAQNQYN